jgi:hypothetical protein
MKAYHKYSKLRGKRISAYIRRNPEHKSIVCYVRRADGYNSVFLKIERQAESMDWGTIVYPKQFRGLTTNKFGAKYGHGIVYVIGQWKR